MSGGIGRPPTLACGCDIRGCLGHGLGNAVASVAARLDIRDAGPGVGRLSHPVTLNAWRRRIVLAVDEWLSIALLLYLWRTGDRAFWPVLLCVIVGVYVIGYGTQWWAERREYRN